MATIGIILSGGLVQSVYVSDDIKALGNIEVEIADFDEDGFEDDRCTAEAQMDNFDLTLEAIY